MKILSRIFLILFVFLVIAVVGIYVFIENYGKDVSQKKLSELLGKKVTLTDARLIFPCGLRFDNVNIEGLLAVKEARAQVGFPVFLNNKIVLASVHLIEPQIVIQREINTSLAQEASQNVGASNNESVPPPLKVPETQKKQFKGLGVMIESLDINNGQLKFSNISSKGNFQLDVENIDLALRNFTYPFSSVKTHFDFTSTILSKGMVFSGNKVEGQGWLNWVKRGMEGKIKVLEPDGSVNLMADLVSENNDMTVKGKLNIRNLAPHDKDASKPESFGDLVFNALQSSGVEMAIDFAFKTKMDNFEVSSIPFTGSVAYEGEKSPFKELEKDLKSIGKKFEDIGKKNYEEDIQGAVK